MLFFKHSPLKKKLLGMQLPRWLLHSCLIILLLLQSTEHALGQKSTPARRRRQKSKNGVVFPETFKTIMKYLILALFGPVLLYFVYSVVRDPVTPHLLWEMSMRCRERISGNVGESTRDVMQRNHPRNVQSRSRVRFEKKRLD